MPNNSLFYNFENDGGDDDDDAMLIDQDNIFLDEHLNLIPSNIFHTDTFNGITDFARFENVLFDGLNDENAMDSFGADLGVDGNGNSVNVDTDFARFEHFLFDDLTDENSMNSVGVDSNGNGNAAHFEQADDALMLNENFNPTSFDENNNGVVLHNDTNHPIQVIFNGDVIIENEVTISNNNDEIIVISDDDDENVEIISDVLGLSDDYAYYAFDFNFH